MAVNIEKIIIDIATKNGVEPKLALDMAKAESTLNPNAIGKAGEVGLYQIHPKYLNYITKTVTGRTYTKEELKDPTLNATVGIGYIKMLQQQLGKRYTPALLIQTYNQGLGYTKKNKYQISNEMMKHPNKIYRGYFTGTQ